MNRREEEEESIRRDEHVKRAELPAPLEHRGLDGYAWNTFQPETPAGKRGSDDEADKANEGALAVGPLEMVADVVRQDKVAEVSGAVPEHVEAVPEALAPQLVAHETVQPGHRRREDKDVEEQAFVLCGSFLEPRRHDGDDEVKADEGIHEPEMSCHRREVPRQTAQVVHRCLPRHAAPSQRKETVEEHEDNHRRQDAEEATAVEVAHAHARLHRHEQECADSHKERYGDATKGSVVEGYPEAVALGGEHGHIACQSTVVGTIKVLTCMHKHHQETRDDAYPIYEGDAVFSCLFHGCSFREGLLGALEGLVGLVELVSLALFVGMGFLMEAQIILRTFIGCSMQCT